MWVLQAEVKLWCRSRECVPDGVFFRASSLIYFLEFYCPNLIMSYCWKVCMKTSLRWNFSPCRGSSAKLYKYNKLFPWFILIYLRASSGMHISCLFLCARAGVWPTSCFVYQSNCQQNTTLLHTPQTSRRHQSQLTHTIHRRLHCWCGP